MKRFFAGLPVLALLVPASVLAQVKSVAPVTAKEMPTPVTRLKLYPAGPAVPSLKYRLLPELRDLKPGNAVVLYYRSFSPEWQSFQKDAKISKALQKWEEERQKPPSGLDFVRRSGTLKELDLAARRAYCDWEMTERLRKEGFMMLLPDVQSFRNYGNLLTARARLEILDKRWDKAIYTLQTGLSMSRHIGEGPTLMQDLVGMAVARQMLVEVEQFIQQPGAPNLYWALTDLPRPFIDQRKSLQGESFMIDAAFPGWREMLANPNSRPLSAAELDDLVRRNIEVMQAAGLRLGSSSEFRPLLAVFAAKSYPEARKFLLNQGQTRELIDAMPVAQVALLYEIHNYDRYFDDYAKWYGQPYPVMRKGTKEATARLKEAKASAAAGTFLATLLVPAAEKVFEASYRLDRKMAGLRCVEAIRLYSAGHGKLPASLKDIVDVPVPFDPYTGQSFDYTVHDGVAILSAPTLPGSLPMYSWKFEITMQSLPKRSNP